MSYFCGALDLVRHRMPYFCGALDPVRRRNSETNYWAWPGVGPTIFLWRMWLCCATKICYFCGAPVLVRHRNNFCGACKSGAPQNSMPQKGISLQVSCATKIIKKYYVNAKIVLSSFCIS
jgi:hypothetical protein